MSAARPTGKFVPLQVPFNTSAPDDAVAQARIILGAVTKEVAANPNVQVGITYSANHHQADDIRRAYNNGQAITGMQGANQAETMMAVERLLQTPEFSALQGKFRILPISTMEYDLQNRAVPTTDAWINEDLNAISAFKAAGNVVFGWQNQFTNDVKKSERRFAIGGGVSSGVDASGTQIFTDEQSKHVQGFLEELRTGLPQSNLNGTANSLAGSAGRELPQNSDQLVAPQSQGVSSMPVNPSTEANLAGTNSSNPEAENKLEADKRREENDKYNRMREQLDEWRVAKGINTAHFIPITNLDEVSKLQQNENSNGSLSSGEPSAMAYAVYKDIGARGAVHVHHDAQPIHIKYDENGYTPIINAKMNDFDKENAARSALRLALQNGVTEVTLNYNDAKHVNPDIIKMYLRQAKELGMKVNFGSTVENAFTSAKMPGVPQTYLHGKYPDDAKRMAVLAELNAQRTDVADSHDNLRKKWAKADEKSFENENKPASPSPRNPS